ncbi:MAG: glycosyltransferase family 87 protein, partial [Candidatus Dormiibacterota bacterium]
VLLMFIPPRGCFAVPVAAACLWTWPAPVQAWLARAGLQRRWLTVTGISVAAAAAIVSLATGGQFDGHLLHGGDFQTYWLGATLGAHDGWSHLFDMALQKAVWPGMAGAREPFLPFLNTPPMAWLVAPLLVLPYPFAYALWVALIALCAVITLVLLVPRNWLAVTALLTAGLWVTPYTIVSGQNAVFGALAVTLTWRLLRAGHDGWAGLALSLILLRPTATLLLPFAILLAGYRRTFAVWSAVSVLVIVVSAWSLGRTGISQFVHLALLVRHSHPHAVQMTILGWLGQNPPAIALEGLLVIAALAVAWHGGRKPAVAIASGVLASLFLTPYIHAQDYVTVLAAAVAVAVPPVQASYGLILVAILAVAPPGLVFGGAWEGVLLTVEVAWLFWLAWGLRGSMRNAELSPALTDPQGG